MYSYCSWSFMIKDLLCWGFSLSPLHTLTWIAYKFPCRRYRLNLDIILGASVGRGRCFSLRFCVNVQCCILQKSWECSFKLMFYKVKERIHTKEEN